MEKEVVRTRVTLKMGAKAPENRSKSAVKRSWRGVPLEDLTSPEALQTLSAVGVIDAIQHMVVAISEARELPDVRTFCHSGFIRLHPGLDRVQGELFGG